MSFAVRRPSTSGHPRRLAFITLTVFWGIVFVVAFAGLVIGLRVNTTPSEPLGIWRIVKLNRAVQIGDIVFVCPPDVFIAVEGLARGYLRSGLCPGGFAPLIKTAIAIGGQRIDVSRQVAVDGRVITCSQVLQRDGQGRPLGPYEGKTVPAGTIFLHSCFYGSWDSRYFGPVPSDGVLGLAEEVLTYAP